jgi:hypothetical protein
MKSSALVLVLLIGALPVSGQRNPQRSAPPVNNDSPAVSLLRRCDESPIRDYTNCIGWLTGAVLGIDAAESLKDTRSICFPKDGVFTQGRFPGADNMVKLFREYVDANPDKLDVHVGHVVYQVLLKAYPCKKP